MPMFWTKKKKVEKDSK